MLFVLIKKRQNHIFNSKLKKIMCKSNIFKKIWKRVFIKVLQTLDNFSSLIFSKFCFNKIELDNQVLIWFITVNQWQLFSCLAALPTPVTKVLIQQRRHCNRGVELQCTSWSDNSNVEKTDYISDVIPLRYLMFTMVMVSNNTLMMPVPRIWR